jgi:hypothetical protein
MLTLVGILSVALIVSVFIGWEQRREGVREGIKRLTYDGRVLASHTFHNELASLLDLQADGGDSPAAYIEWAITEAIARTERKDTP